MPSFASFGRDPLAVVITLERAAQVTGVDLEYAGELMRSVILEKTARGVDADRTSFAAYSTGVDLSRAGDKTWRRR